MPRARAHAAARIYGAECTRALQVRRRWSRRSAQRGATGAECGASACGLTPKEEAAAAAAAAAAASTETTCARHRRHATVSSESLRSPRGRCAIGRVVARRFDAAGVSTAATTGTVARKRRRIPRRGSMTSSSTGGADSPGCVRGVRSRRSRFRRRPRLPLTPAAVREFRGRLPIGVFERDAPLWLCLRRRLGCRPGCVCAAGFRARPLLVGVSRS
jgi:hypothetical protein